MYIDDVLEKYKGKKIRMFVDMDGVIADYEVGLARDYDIKRPLKSNIKKLKEIAEDPNIEMNILSVTRHDTGFEQKNIWLDKFAPFFEKKHRNILSRESNEFQKSSILKANFLKEVKRNRVIIVIDDDPIVLKRIHKQNEDIILLKDTALVK